MTSTALMMSTLLGIVLEGARRISADIICDFGFEPIATGSWEAARVMETPSRRTLRGLSSSSQRQFSARFSAVPSRARHEAHVCDMAV